MKGLLIFWPQYRLSGLRNRSGVCLLLILLLSSPALANGLQLDGAMPLGEWSPLATRYQSRQSVCAWSTALDLVYRVTAISRPNTNFEQFELHGDLGDRIRFIVRWRDTRVSTSWEQLTPGLPSGGTYRFDNTASCSSTNTQIDVRLVKSDANQAASGLYSSELTITLVAE